MTIKNKVRICRKVAWFPFAVKSGGCVQWQWGGGWHWPWQRGGKCWPTQNLNLVSASLQSG